MLHVLKILTITTLIATPLALAQVPSSSTKLSPSKENESLPRRLKIDLSIDHPQDLKVREGDKVTRGQVLADRDSDRDRLLAERREALLTKAKIERTPAPQLKISPPLPELPAANYSIEEAEIQKAEIRFAQAQRNYNNALSNDPFITARANVDFARAGVEQAYRDVENQQKKLEAIAQIKGLPPEMLTHETEKLKAVRSNWEKKQAEFDFREAEYKQVEQGRREMIESLKAAIESARGELEIAQARLRKAKETRNRIEYEHQLNAARQNEAVNQSAIAVSQQNLEREFKLSQIKEQIATIDEKLDTIAVVRSPFTGTIKRVKIENQSNNTLKITLSLIPDQ
jgi:multidrug efflux pump subunit AcrA (membrane-fusion protein)